MRLTIELPASIDEACRLMKTLYDAVGPEASSAGPGTPTVTQATPATSAGPFTGAPSAGPVTGAPSAGPVTGAPSAGPFTGAPSAGPVTGAPTVTPAASAGPVTGAPSAGPGTPAVTPAAPGASGYQAAPVNPGDLDDQNIPYNPELHASPGSKTKSGAWRKRKGRKAVAEVIPDTTTAIALPDHNDPNLIQFNELATLAALGNNAGYGQAVNDALQGAPIEAYIGQGAAIQGAAIRLVFGLHQAGAWPLCAEALGQERATHLYSQHS